MDTSKLPPHFLEVLQLETMRDSLPRHLPDSDLTCRGNDMPYSNGLEPLDKTRDDLDSDGHTLGNIGECDKVLDETLYDKTEGEDSLLSQALHTLSLEITSEGVVCNNNSSSIGTNHYQDVTPRDTIDDTISRDQECLPSLNKYYGITTPSIDADKNDFDYILLVHNFHPAMKTKDIIKILMSVRSENFKIKWVDDTHALAIYVDSKGALAASKEPYDKVDVELLSKSSHEESIAVARRCGASIRESLIKKLEKSSVAVSRRPPTTASVARRMVGHALGVRITASPEQREKEKKEVEEVKKQKKSKRAAAGLV